MPPKPSIIVDHIDGKAAEEHDYRRDNLQGLCRYHDGLKSIAENKGFGGNREGAAPAGCDASGIPVDPNHPWRKAIGGSENRGAVFRDGDISVFWPNSVFSAACSARIFHSGAASVRSLRHEFPMVGQGATPCGSLKPAA